MARTFIPSYTKRSGKRGRSKNYHVEFEDHLGTRRRVVGFPVAAGKARSDALGVKLQRLASCRAVSEPLPADLRDWIDNMAPDLRDKLAAWGVIDKPRHERYKPISFHLIGYMHAMKAKGGNRRHVRMTIRKLLAVMKHCGVRQLADITDQGVESYLTARRLDKNSISPKTSNAYLKAVQAFCKWLVPSRLSHSPVAGVKSMPVAEEEHRWPLTIGEMRTLLDATSAAPARFGMSGSERALLYRVAVETGYRAGELRSLIRESFDLDSDTPTVRLLAGSSKGKRRSSIPLRPETAVMLRGHLAAKSPAASAFGVPPSTHTAEMIRADLLEAGVPISDALGRKRDFHALRHTTGTWLANANIHPRLMQSILRHANITTTMSIYAHADQAQTNEAIGRLPSLSEVQSAPLAATGTGGACARLAPEHGQPATNLDKPGRKDRGGVTGVSVAPVEGKPLKQGEWARLDSNQRRHKPADLQSAPFGRFGTRPVNPEE